MARRLNRDILVRNTETPEPGWPYQIISAAAIFSMAAEPRATRPPERRGGDDDDDDEPPSYRRR
eukprot:6927261-Prorocentrum_lima.AAC.1